MRVAPDQYDFARQLEQKLRQYWAINAVIVVQLTDVNFGLHGLFY